MNELTAMRKMEWLLRERQLPQARPQVLWHRGQKESLHVVYVLTHVGVCGGVKVVLQHANGLRLLGVRVTIVAHFPKPQWHPVEAEYICVPFQYEVATGIPPCDVIVATYWDHIHACVERGIAPVVYFEQGDFHLYDWERDKFPAEVHAVARKQYALPPYVCTVSRSCAAIIGEKFGREAAVFPNALNTNVFYPKRTQPQHKYMLIVGSEQAAFKGIADLKQVYSRVRQCGYEVELRWITPQPPLEPAGEVYINPPQEMIGELYREAFVYVCGSYYETFPLPPLEAMACGTPVVTTDNLGGREYCRDGVNCLKSAPGDVDGLSSHVIRLLDDADLYHRLQQAGYQTAAAYQWPVILADLRKYYETVAEYVPAAKNMADEWIKGYTVDDLLEPQDQDQLEGLLAHTDADEILFPVVHATAAGAMISWEPLARRKSSGTGYQTKAGWRIDGSRLARSWDSAVIAGLYGQGLFALALEEALCKLGGAKDKAVQAVYTRWLILCLMQLGMANQALELAERTLTEHPLYTDLLYLAAKLALDCGLTAKARLLAEKCVVLQDAAYYPEFISDIGAKATALFPDGVGEK